MKLRPGVNLNSFIAKSLSRKAHTISIKNEAAIFAYSYCAYEAFRPGPKQPRYRFLFQLHPHHQSVHRILSEELQKNPLGRASLNREAELHLKGEAFNQLACEPNLSNGWVVASSYTALTLSENGIPLDKIHVVPYGVDFTRFEPRKHAPDANKPFTIIYVGSLVQRKGLSYLLESVRQLKTKNVRLLLRGRGNIDRDLLAHYSDVKFDLKVNISTQELVQDLHRSDVFALPSLTEGFAHVILEAMACGLPIITTANTCAPDVLVEGVHGYIVPIQDANAIADKIAWGIDNRMALAAMGSCAAEQARLFTWERFRIGVRDAYRQMVENVQGDVAMVD